MFEIECPSGLTIEASSLYGRDTIAIAERVGANASGDTLVAFMSRCTKRVLDPGPYPAIEPGDGSPDWQKALWGDLLFAIIKLRIESFPEHRGKFDFEFSCPHCRGLADGSIDLADLIADPDHFQPLPEASRETLLARELFKTTTPSGQEVTFDLMRPAHDEPMKVLMKRAKRYKETDVEAIAKRVRKVKGLVSSKGEEKRQLQDFWRWAEGLADNDIDALLFAMNRADIVVDSKILAWCNNLDTDCRRQSRIPLPLNMGFFRPRSGTKRASTALPEGSPPSSPESPANGGTPSKPISSGTKPKDPASPSPAPTS